MMRFSLIALGLAAALAACTGTGEVDPRARAVGCLPRGVYLGEALGADYAPARKAAIDALRVVNCPDPVALGYATEAG